MSEPRVGRWIAKPLKPRKRFIDVAWIWGIPFWGFGLAQKALGTIPALFSEGIDLVCSATFLVFIVVLPAREVWVRRRTGRDRAFSDGLMAVPEFAVEIVVETKGVKPGADRGVVWFDRGLIGFTGERTSFLLAYEDLRSPPSGSLTNADRPFRPLEMRMGSRRASVTVRPLWGEARRYRRALRRFFAERAATEGDRQWPPLVAYEAQALKSKVDEVSSERLSR